MFTVLMYAAYAAFGLVTLLLVFSILLQEGKGLRAGCRLSEPSGRPALDGLAKPLPALVRDAPGPSTSPVEGEPSQDVGEMGRQPRGAELRPGLSACGGPEGEEGAGHELPVPIRVLDGDAQAGEGPVGDALVLGEGQLAEARHVLPAHLPVEVVQHVAGLVRRNVHRKRGE